MKKITVSLCLLMAAGLSLKAQVGVNTTHPSTTLEVVSTSDAALADGILIPRVTLKDLNDKDGLYKAEHNGALVFVKDIGVGTAQDKAIEVTTTGFYYYDAPNSKWKAVGTSATPTPATIPTFRTVQGGTPDPLDPAPIPKTVKLLASDIGNVVIFSGGIDGYIKFPDVTPADKGRRMTIIEISGLSHILTNPNPNYKTNTLGILQRFGSEFITDGENWYALGGQ